MAPLSHDLAGIILPFDHFGSHLNSRGETTDKVMEKANFAKAGEVLDKFGLAQSLMDLKLKPST
jgi:hypothetical protein